MESASLLSRESTTLSFSKPQKGHFMSDGEVFACIVTGENEHNPRRPGRPRPGRRAQLANSSRAALRRAGEGARPYVSRRPGGNHPAGGMAGYAASAW